MIKISKPFVAASLIFAAAIAAGCVYASRAGDFENLRAYVSGFFAEGAAQDKKEIFMSALKTNAEVWLLITAGSLVKIGAVFPAAILAKRGFLTGFTSAAMCRIYGAKGMTVMLAELPKNIVVIPLMLIYSCCAVAFAFREDRGETKIYARFFGTAALCCLLFVLCAFMEAYVSVPLLHMLTRNF